MSIRTCQNNVAKTLKEIADLEKKSSDETKKEVSKSKDIDRIKRSITSSISSSTFNSKQQQILRLADDIANIHKKKADYSKKIADKTTQLNRYG